MNVVIQSSEVTSMKRDLDKQKEVASASEIKIKWNQNKLKAEQDAHKVCRSSVFRFILMLTVLLQHVSAVICESGRAWGL